MTQILTTGNLGSAELAWNIDEAPAQVAPVPAAVASSGDRVENNIVPDPNKLQEDSMLDVPGDHSLTAAADFELSTVPFSPRIVTPQGVLVNDGSFEKGPPPASAWTETTGNLCEWIGDWSAVWGAAAYDGVNDYWGAGYCSGMPS